MLSKTLHSLPYSEVFLKRSSYIPSTKPNRFSFVGNVIAARHSLLTNLTPSTHHLLNSRFTWFKYRIEPGKLLIELGSGPALLPIFLNHNLIVTTDITNNPLVDSPLFDLQSLKDSSVDYFFLSHMIHHVAFPLDLLATLSSKLKPTGSIFISDVNDSLFLRLILRIMRHEGWSRKYPLTTDHIPQCDPSDPWSANCSITSSLSELPAPYLRQRCNLVQVYLSHVELFDVLLSGGIISRLQSIPKLPSILLNLLLIFQKPLLAFFPNIFALGLHVELKKP